MKTTSRIILGLAAMTMPLLVTNCSMDPRVIETRRFDVGNRHFVQERLLICDRPYETRIMSREVFWPY